MIQDILAEPEWADVLTPEDLRPDPAVLGARPALRRSQAQHDPAHRLQRRPDRRDQRRAELSDRQARTATGGSRPTCHLVPCSLNSTPIPAEPARA
jgi:hypothetical protein